MTHHTRLRKHHRSRIGRRAVQPHHPRFQASPSSFVHISGTRSGRRRRPPGPLPQSPAWSSLTRARHGWHPLLRGAMRIADNPLSTNALRAASIMTMYLRLILVTTLSLAAIACPMLCADSSAPHDSHSAPCSPDGHNRPCDNSCFCSSATPQQSPWRSMQETNSTSAAFVNNTPLVHESLPNVTSIRPLLAVIQLGSAAEQPLPLLI